MQRKCKDACICVCVCKRASKVTEANFIVTMTFQRSSYVNIKFYFCAQMSEWPPNVYAIIIMTRIRKTVMSTYHRLGTVLGNLYMSLVRMCMTQLTLMSVQAKLYPIPEKPLHPCFSNCLWRSACFFKLFCASTDQCFYLKKKVTRKIK